jgi:glycosyltransferase involved in cell wall biosynthesis
MNPFLICSPVSGGVCQYTYCLAEALQCQGAATTVLTQNYPAYELAQRPRRHTVRSDLRTSMTPLARLLNPRRNLRTVLTRSEKSEVLHYQWPLGPRQDLIQWKALKRAGKRIVFTAHNVEPHESGNRGQSHTEWLYTHADAIIVHGKRLRDMLLQANPSVPPSRVHVHRLGNYNFIADDFPKWNRVAARESLGWSDEEQAVLFFGFLRHYKGLDVLIEACKQILAETPDLRPRFRLLIVGPSYGDHWENERYEERIAKAGLGAETTCVVEHVPLEEVGRYFHAADVVALPYRQGSQSAVIPLAYAFGKPVITTDVGSLAEAVVPGETGLVVPPEDSTALAAALSSLLRAGERSRIMGRNARCYAETVLDWQPIALATSQLYSTLDAT